jgi:MarR family transcriptional regulator, lower aerobic nicotinate degradation pathway regulator
MSASVKKKRRPESLGDLYSRPGFLLRRGHQIAVGIFEQECNAIGLTSPQHGVLVVADNAPGLDQAGIARALGFDRATIGALVQGLERRGLLQRKSSAADLRRKTLVVTPRGRELLRRAQVAVRHTSDRILAPLAIGERQRFVLLLEKLTGALNGASRTPLLPPATQD